jgi:heme-degrading monooxygenase HmoA
MYGTVARMKFKPGMGQKFAEMMEQQSGQRRTPPGWVGEYVYQMDKDPNEYYVAIIFESKAAYVANANSPEQHEEYLQYRQFLEIEPDWHDARSLRLFPDIGRHKVTRLLYNVHSG